MNINNLDPGADTSNLLVDAVQGPPGRPGDQTILPAGSSTLIAGKIVALGLDGQLKYADNTSLTDAYRIVGITTVNAQSNDPTNIKNYGPISDPSWSFDSDVTLYLGTNGDIVSTPPTAEDASFLVIVGFPMTGNQIFINIREPILLI